MDEVLEKPHPHFALIKKHWPHFFSPPARNGDAVYFEVRTFVYRRCYLLSFPECSTTHLPTYFLQRTGEFDMPALLKEGVGVDALLHHCVFSTEYVYKHMFGRDLNERKVRSYPPTHLPMQSSFNHPPTLW